MSMTTKVIIAVMILLYVACSIIMAGLKVDCYVKDKAGAAAIEAYNNGYTDAVRDCKAGVESDDKRVAGAIRAGMVKIAGKK